VGVPRLRSGTDALAWLSYTLRWPCLASGPGRDTRQSTRTWRVDLARPLSRRARRGRPPRRRVVATANGHAPAEPETCRHTTRVWPSSSGKAQYTRHAEGTSFPERRTGASGRDVGLKGFRRSFMPA